MNFLILMLFSYALQKSSFSKNLIKEILCSYWSSINGGMMNKSLSILTMSALMVACSDGGKTDSGITDLSPQNPNNLNPEASLVRQVQSSALLDDGCENGGSVFEFGFDFNENGALDDAEVDSERTKILCHGEDGEVGYSAFQIWSMAGNEGTEADFLASLVGTSGANGADGNNGTNGDDGSSAYDIWLAAGNRGTEVDFLASLVGQSGGEGTKGDTGAPGAQGPKGADGDDGAAGSNGQSAPAITSSSFFYLTENSDTSYTAVAVDVDVSDQLMFALVGGEDFALFDIDSSSGVLTFKVSPDFEYPADADENNVYEVDLSVTDGTFTTTKALLIKVRDFKIIPKIVTAEITSIPLADNIYQDDEIISINLTFDSAVDVEGSPYVILDIGGQTKHANYLSGTGTEVLTFTYMVVAEDRDAVTIAENGLALNNGSIISVNNNDGLAASLALAEESNHSSQEIDNSAPVLLSSNAISRFKQIVPAAGAYNQKAQSVVNTVLIDKDDDEDLDILYISQEQQYAYWLINNDGKLNQLQSSSEEFYARDASLNAKDINGDKFADIVIVRGGERPNGTRAIDNMSIHLSNVLGEYAEQELDFPASDFTAGNIVIADMNGDEFDDIVVATGLGASKDYGKDLGLGEGVQDYGKRILIVLNDGNNVFSRTNVHYMGTDLSENGSMLSVVDLDGDGLLDIVATSASGAKEIKLFKNITEDPTAPEFEEHGLMFNIDAMGKKSIHLDVNGDNFVDVLIPGTRTELGSEVVENTNSLTLLINTTTINAAGKSTITFATTDFTDVPSSNGTLGAGDLDGDTINDFAFKTLTYSAWYKGDGSGGFTKFDRSHLRTNDQAELSQGISIADLNGDGLNEVVSALGRGSDKNDSMQTCNWCLDIWQNTPSYDLVVPENTEINTVLTTFSADDVDSTVRFSLNGPDSQLFAIDELTGALSIITLLDFELPEDSVGDATIDEATNRNAVAGDNFYQLSIVISDGLNEVSTPVTVLVTDVIVEEVVEEIVE